MTEKKINELAEIAVKNKESSNCCQAVTAALAESEGIKVEQLNAIAAGFGAGMGNMEGVCGALIGAIMIAGIKSNGQGTTKTAKIITNKFCEKTGALYCKDLKGIGTGKMLCSCPDCVRNAVKAYCEIAKE